MFAVELNDPGLVERFEIQTGGYNYEVISTANFGVEDLEFSAEEKKITLYINSGVTNNLGEIQIPVNLTSGNFTFFLNDQEIEADVKRNNKISLVTLEFVGKGKHTVDIIGTTYLPEFAQIAPMVLGVSLLGILLLRRYKKFNF